MNECLVIVTKNMATYDLLFHFRVCFALVGYIKGEETAYLSVAQLESEKERASIKT